MNTIAEMTREELKQFIEDLIDEKLTRALGVFEIPDEDDEGEELAWDEIRANVEKHRWTPPAGSKTSLEFLREDRES